MFYRAQYGNGILVYLRGTPIRLRGHLFEGAKSGIFGTFELDFQVRYMYEAN